MHNRAPPNVTIPHMSQQRPRGYQNAHHQQIHPQQTIHQQPPPQHHPHAQQQQMMYHQQPPHDQAMMTGHLPMSQVRDMDLPFYTIFLFTPNGFTPIFSFFYTIFKNSKLGVKNWCKKKKIFGVTKIGIKKVKILV